MFEFTLPLIFLSLGILLTFFRERSAVLFCRLGKAIWRHSTFGLTDMGSFYKEENARKVFRLMGPLFLCIGLLFSWFCYLSFSGPGAFCAMREARTYLESQYGNSATWSVSSQLESPDGSVDLSYRYASRVGRLHATWQKDHYVFSEIVSNSSKK